MDRIVGYEDIKSRSFDDAWFVKNVPRFSLPDGGITLNEDFADLCWKECFLHCLPKPFKIPKRSSPIAQKARAGD